MDRLAKIKAALPVEVTGAFIAFRELFTQRYGASTHADMMVLAIAFLFIVNAIYYVRTVSSKVTYVLFVNVGMVIWCLNADLDRWKDPFSLFGIVVDVPADFTTFILPALLIAYSLCLALFIGGGANVENARSGGGESGETKEQTS